MKIFVIDVETTGLDPKEHGVVEIAFRELARERDEWTFGPATVAFINPGRPIGFDAMGMHHIIEADVASACSLDHIVSEWFPPGSLTHAAFAAHNATFDRSFLPMLTDAAAWIDTYRCARHLFPDAPSFANCALFYFLGFPRPIGVTPHQAGFDTMVTARILAKMLTMRSFDELMELSAKPVILKKVNFGKHYGQLWGDVPFDYLQWASRQDFDADVKHTIKSEIEGRKAPQQRKAI